MAIDKKMWLYQERTDLPKSEPKLNDGYSHDLVACWWANRLDSIQKKYLEEFGNPAEQSALANEFRRCREEAGTEQLRPSQMRGLTRFKRLRKTWTQDSCAQPPPSTHTRTESTSSILLTEEVVAEHCRQKSIMESLPLPSPQITAPPLRLTTGPIQRPKKPGRPPEKRTHSPIPKNPLPPRISNIEPYNPLESELEKPETQEPTSPPPFTVRQGPFRHTRQRLSNTLALSSIQKQPLAPPPPARNASEELFSSPANFSHFSNNSPEPLRDRFKPFSSSDEESMATSLFRYFVYDYKNTDQNEPDPPQSTWEKVAGLTHSTWADTCQSCRDVWEFLV